MPWYLCEDCIKQLAEKVASAEKIIIVTDPPQLPLPITGGGGGGKSLEEQLFQIGKSGWFSSKAR